MSLKVDDTEVVTTVIDCKPGKPGPHYTTRHYIVGISTKRPSLVDYCKEAQMRELVELTRRSGNVNCADDHGERTNIRLLDQPYHQRTRNGKMKKW